MIFTVGDAHSDDPLFDAPVNYIVGYVPNTIFSADLDSDGDYDLAVANYADYGDIYILKNNSDGTFATAVNYEAGDSPVSIFSVDLHGDSDSDLAVTNGNASDVYFYRIKAGDIVENREMVLLKLCNGNK